MTITITITMAREGVVVTQIQLKQNAQNDGNMNTVPVVASKRHVPQRHILVFKERYSKQPFPQKKRKQLQIETQLSH